MWPLKLKRSISISKEVSATSKEVLEILHDPDKFCMLSPLVRTCGGADDEPLVKYVTERLPIIGGWEGSTGFMVRLTILDDGIVARVAANLGTTLVAEYKVEKKEDGTCLVREDCEVEGVFLLMPYIVRTMTMAQKSVLDNLAVSAERPSGD